MSNIDSYFTLIKRLNILIEAHVNHSIQEYDMTMSQGAIIYQLINAPEKMLPLKQLEQGLKLSQPVTAGIVKRLEEKGFIQSLTDPNDRRVKIVKPTELAESKLMSARKSMLELESELLSCYSQDDKQQFGKYLLELKENIETKWR